MPVEETTRRVLELVAKVADHVAPDTLGTETTFDALGFDSIRQLRLLAEIERALGVELPAEALFGIGTIGDLVAAVAAQATQPA